MDSGSARALVLGLAGFGRGSCGQLHRYSGIHFLSFYNLSHAHINHQVRSGYRVAELAYGYQGFLVTTEAYFYLLDTLPLVIANLAYVPCWPGRFIPGTTTQEDVELKSSPHSNRLFNRTALDGRSESDQRI